MTFVADLLLDSLLGYILHIPLEIFYDIHCIIQNSWLSPSSAIKQLGSSKVSDLLILEKKDTEEYNSL